MRCETMKRKLSDDLDGTLSPRRKARLEAHLRECPSCRAYGADILRLQEGAAQTEGRSPEYWAGFEKRLASKLASVEPVPMTAGGPAFLRRRVIWTAASFLALVAVGTYFALIRPGGNPAAAWVPYEDPMVPLLQEAESDLEFGNLVNREILASIEDMTLVPEAETAFPSADDPLFWEGLSEDELELIAAELKKETGLGGPK